MSSYYQLQLTRLQLNIPSERILLPSSCFSSSCAGSLPESHTCNALLGRHPSLQFENIEINGSSAQMVHLNPLRLESNCALKQGIYSQDSVVARNESRVVILNPDIT